MGWTTKWTPLLEISWGPVPAAAWFQGLCHRRSPKQGAALRHSETRARAVCESVPNAALKLAWLVIWNINVIFPSIGNFIIPTDWLLYFSMGVVQPPISGMFFRFQVGGTSWISQVPWLQGEGWVVGFRMVILCPPTVVSWLSDIISVYLCIQLHTV